MTNSAEGASGLRHALQAGRPPAFFPPARFQRSPLGGGVKTQLWVAPIVRPPVAILKKRLGLKASLCKFLRISSVTLFEKMPVVQVSEDTNWELSSEVASNQLTLFDL